MCIRDRHGPAQLGDYYLNRSGMVDMPEEWKGGIDTAQFGRYVAQQEQGVFTQYGYLVKSGDEWQKVYEGQPVPEEYRVLSFPVSEILQDAADVYKRQVLTEEQLSAYSLYMRTLGNRPDLFGQAQYPNASTIKQPTYYDIPPEALKDDRLSLIHI